MPKFLEYPFTFLAAIGGTGSSIGWVVVHKAHHRYSDRPGDPHCPEIGGWKNMISLYDYTFSIFHAKRMLRSKFHLFMHQYYYLIFIAWGLLLLAISYKLLLFGFIVPVAIQIWTSNISNYGNHMWGYKNYPTRDNSRNTWWIAAITWGEGWHNNHHARPRSYTFKSKWWEFDVSGTIIWVISLITGNKKHLKT
jgi:stearoyl-CoA desaturase (delta-9 desaturase)